MPEHALPIQTHSCGTIAMSPCSSLFQNLCYVFFRGSKARKWLLHHCSNTPGLLTAGSTMTQVKELTIATEGICLSPSVILPLADWIIKVFITRMSEMR